MLIKCKHAVLGSHLILHSGPIEGFSFQSVLHEWCNNGHGMCYPVFEMVHVKEPLLLIKKNNPCSGGSRFSDYVVLYHMSDAI